MDDEEMEIILKQNSLQKFSSLKISSLEEEEQEDDIDDDDDDDVEEDEEVTLGFLEKPKNINSLLPQFFPSKAGGTPAWLDPVNLPSGKSCICDICGEPLQFLLQVYAPISGKEYTFHRTLFVFMCPSMACLLQDQHQQWKRRPESPSRSVKVFRCQLPRINNYYSAEPPKNDKTSKSSEVRAALCSWCGTWKGDKICSSCQSARYCSEKHQARHWRSGHKLACQRISISCPSSESSFSNGRITSTETIQGASTTLWPEFEIINEDESEFDTESAEEDFSTSLVVKEQVDETYKTLMADFEGDDDKRSWTSFHTRIAKAPEQVLRYSRDAKAKPLWPTSSGRPSKADIPKCSCCNGPLCFEMQILPQLLYYFGVKNDIDSLDWATITIYTCEESCESKLAYKEEFAWVQLSSPSG